MKIDLHCHTLKTKKGDAETRNIDAVSFKTIINNSNVKIAAITNHNVFNINQYNEFVKVCNNDFQIWPGIELDVLGKIVDKDGKRKAGHVIVISNPQYVAEFDLEAKKLIKGVSPDDVQIEIDTLLKFYSCLSDAIILPHYFKPKALDQDSIDLIRNGIKEKYRFFYEPANYRSLGILNNHDCPSLMGSDVKNWNDYSSYEISDLKLDVDSFEQFIFLARKDQNIVDTLLNKKSYVEIDISHKDKQKKKQKKEKEIVRFYDDVNIIFGAKGTGKSDVLNRVIEYYNSKNIDYSYYTPNTTEDEINSKLTIEPNERKLDNFDFNDCETDFEDIINWKEAFITPLKDFWEYRKSKDKNKNKNKLKILDSKIYQGINENTVNSEKETLKKIKRIENELLMINLKKYINEKDITILGDSIVNLKERIKNSFQKEWINYESKNSANKSIEVFKTSVEKNTETKTKPNRTGLFNFCNNRFALMIAIENIKNGFDYSFNTEPIFMGNLEKNKPLYLSTRYRMLDKDCKTEEFVDNITDLKVSKKLIDDTTNHFFDVNLSAHINKLSDFLREHKIMSLNKFLAVKKTFTLSNQVGAAEYKPSTGEATMIILQDKLNEMKNVFILDEPEKSLGNTYVNEIIVPKLVNLAKTKKTVIVVTHNANIAVRTFPYTSILKVYNDGNYETYVGNPFINKLVSITDSSKSLDWKIESLKILEGGKMAFEERGEIYGQERN